MKLVKVLSLFIMSLFLISSTGAMISIQPNIGGWGEDWISGGTDVDLVYEVTVADLASSGSLPIFTDNGQESYQIGELKQGDLVFMRLDLPSLSSGDLTVFADFSSTGTSENWSFQYDANATKNPGWPSETNGPILLSPQIPVPTDGANWDLMASEWDAADNALHSVVDTTENVFQISGDSNVQLNITAFEINWFLDTGIMKNYTVSALENDGSTFELGLEFKYQSDESDWNLSWGVYEDDVFVFNFNTATVNGTSGIEFGESNDGNYINSGDSMLIQINQLSDFLDSTNWNGTVRSSNFSSYDFDYKYVNVRRTSEPMFFIPIIPIGNTNFLNNITDQFNAIGATTTVADRTLSVSINDNGVSQTASWDLTTGLLQSMTYDGVTEGDHLVVDLELAYHWGFDGHQPMYSIERFDERYVIDDITNGSSQYLDFGLVELTDELGNRVEKEFQLHEGDIFEISGQLGLNENQEEMWSWFGKTSSGFEVQAMFEQWYPGFEFGEGPPGLFFVIPNTLDNETAGKASDAYFVKVDRDTTTQNAQVVIDDLEFGFTTTQNGLTLTVRWDKATGLLNYYKVDGTDPETGNHVTWEMHRSIYNIRDPSVLSWGVAPGTFTEYGILLVTGQIEFGDTGATLSSGDVIGAKITGLGDFETDGPSITVDLTLNGLTDSGVEMGLVAPGFELVENNGPPLLYFAIPVGDDGFFDTLVGMYNDAGYNMARNGTHVGGTISITDSTVNGNSLYYNIEVYWEKLTGLLAYYSIETVDEDGNDIGFTIVKLGGDVVPTSDNSASDAPAPLPVSGSAILAIPFIGFAVMVIRRRTY